MDNKRLKTIIKEIIRTEIKINNPNKVDLDELDDLVRQLKGVHSEEYWNLNQKYGRGQNEDREDFYKKLEKQGKLKTYYLELNKLIYE